MTENREEGEKDVSRVHVSLLMNDRTVIMRNIITSTTRDFEWTCIEFHRHGPEFYASRSSGRYRLETATSWGVVRFQQQNASCAANRGTALVYSSHAQRWWFIRRKCSLTLCFYRSVAARKGNPNSNRWLIGPGGIGIESVCRYIHLDTAVTYFKGRRGTCRLNRRYACKV